jgi:hypothetical protein
MIGRRPLLARGKWLPVLCTGMAVSFLGIAGDGGAPGRESISVTTRGLHPASTLSPNSLPRDWIFNVNELTVFGPSASISSDAIFGDEEVFDDPAEGVIHVTKEVSFQDYVSEAKFLAPNFVAEQASALNKGVVFLGQDLSTAQAQLDQVNIGEDSSRSQPQLEQEQIGNAVTPTLIVYPLRPGFSLSKGGGIKANEKGDYVGWSSATGTVFLHWSNMADGQVTYYDQPTNSNPVDATTYPAGGFSVLNRDTKGIIQFLPDGSAPKYITLAFKGSSLTAGPNGNLFVGDFDQPLVHELNPLGQQVAQYPVRATFGLTFLSFGDPPVTNPPNLILVSAMQPRTVAFSVLDPTNPNLVTETDVTHSGNNTLTDYKVVPGSYPLTILLNEFDPVARKGRVMFFTATGRDPNRDAVSHRFDLDPYLSVVSSH